MDDCANNGCSTDMSNLNISSDEDEYSEAMDIEEVPVLTEENTINILIIGETGVGKSTFINAFANYLRFENLSEVERETPMVLIPCKFTVTDENYELREVKIGSDTNEHNELGQSSTQDPRTYTFPISNAQKFVRLIDTPGIGDTRGIDQDAENCQKIIDFIAPLKVIHGIMFLLKPNSTKITVLFEFCMKQILSRLEKSASQNLLFVFTNTRGTCYRPGETLPCLRKVLESISKRPPYVSIPLSKKNIFCLDNEAFRYLAAIANGVQFTDKERQYFAESWDKSAEESWRMIIHIIGDDQNEALQPHQVEHTMCINEARGLINQLKQPMADITQLIQDKLRALKKHAELLKLDNLDIEDLRKNLVIPIIDIEVIELPKPVTVCTSSKCAKVIKVRDVDKWHYIQRCHNPCYLQNVPREMIGAPELLGCYAMNGKQTCQFCSCDFSTHMHIYYESQTVDKTIENDHVKKNLMSKQELKKEKEKIINDMKIMKEELENEHKTIIQYIAQFAKFLQQNAITPYNDVYRRYIEYLIDREKSLGEAADSETIKYLIRCQYEYDEAKKIFDKVLDTKSQDPNVPALTAEMVRKSVNKLFALKHTGKKIEELYNTQKLARKSENMSNGLNVNSLKTSKKSRKNGGIINYYSNKLKNFVTGSQNNESDEDNTHNSYASSYGKATGWQKYNKKQQYQLEKPANNSLFNFNNSNGKKKNKKKEQKKDNYEDELKKMRDEATAALANLASL